MGHASLSSPAESGGRPRVYLLNAVAYSASLLACVLLHLHVSHRQAAGQPSVLEVPGYAFTEAGSPHFPLYFGMVGMAASTLVIFASSLLVGNSSMFDAYWSVAPPFLFLYFVVAAGARLVASRALLQGFVILLWAARLTYNCFLRWDGMHQEDWRYTQFRKFGLLAYWTVSLLGFHLFPAALISAGSISMYVSLHLGSAPFNVGDLVALAIGILAIGLEHFADSQMNEFLRLKEAKRIKQDCITTGLWAYSRHPNYLGEILFWVAQFAFAVAAAPDWQEPWLKVALVGPALMACLFLFVSIPMMEARSARRKGYAEYKKRTASLVPFLFWPCKNVGRPSPTHLHHLPDDNVLRVLFMMPVWESHTERDNHNQNGETEPFCAPTLAAGREEQRREG